MSLRARLQVWIVALAGAASGARIAWSCVKLTFFGVAYRIVSKSAAPWLATAAGIV